MPPAPTLKQLVEAIVQHEGVEAVLVIGRDGLLVDGRSGSAPVDLEALAAHLPRVLTAAAALGGAADGDNANAARGELLSTVMEFEQGLALAAVLSPDASLLVLLGRGANAGPLLYDLRRFRGRIASII
ncbi:MAG TPA: roadblock/LC7 domain-containing protein [Gemmatimonadaceae bacterium]|nr:roadblock/LC7 domain-containing protein [Gemmatimonadaceae bacterium]